MKKLALLLFVALLSGAAEFPAKPAPTPPSSVPAAGERAGKDYALFFAINDYDQWPDLANPIAEVEAVVKDLRDLYGFETEIVRNPDRTTILDKIEVYRQKTYASDGQLLVFFSGHGEFNEATKQGYFVPKNGLKKDVYGDSYIEYESLKRRITSLPCPHIMLALDACYSGTADEGVAMRGDPGTRPGDNAVTARERYISSSLQYKSRIMLTSGAKVRTPDKSAFVAKFLEALRSQGGSDGLVNISELFGYLTTAVPKPIASTFGDHEPGGEFLFIGSHSPSGVPESPGPSSGSASTEADDRAFEKATTRNTGAAYQDYLDVFPNGRHQAEARDNIKLLEIPDDGLVLIPGGTFLMGCTDEQQDCGQDENPAHSVTVSDFYLGKYEVTQKRWKQIMGSNPSTFAGCDDCPVENVSWNDVQAFIQTLNKTTTNGKQYRLPTEAEWEYAARSPAEGTQTGGGKAVLFGNGKNIAKPAEMNFDAGKDAQKTYSIAGYRRGKTVPVGSLNNPNGLGLHDMSGNVREWCSDWYAADYYHISPSANPTGAGTGTERVIRGGSWGSPPKNCRTSFRDFDRPGSRLNGVGFRLARTK